MSVRARSRSSRAAIAVAVTAAAVAVAAVAVNVNTAAAAGIVPAQIAGPVPAVARMLPFDPPAPVALRTGPRAVFAHYMPLMTVSLDNQPTATDYYQRNYLQPDGEHSKFAQFGGFVRDRPAGRPVRAGTDWRLRDMQDEVRQASAAGIDGFSMDIIQVAGGSVPQMWANENLMMQAAATAGPDFKVMIVPDMFASLGDKDPVALADGLAPLAKYPSAYRLADGRLLVAPFKAERHSPDWWRQFKDAMQTRHGERVALMPTFVGDISMYAAAYAPVSYGLSNWGSRNPDYNNTTATGPGSGQGRAALVHSLGVKWMQPVSLQDQRPSQQVFDEAGNTKNLRATWQLARTTGAEFVQIPTWNDYSEGTGIAPSARSGSSFLDMNSYYAVWYKTGKAPVVKRDMVYVTHRTQMSTAKPSYPTAKPMVLRGGTQTRDTVEVLTFATAPGHVTVTVGGRVYGCDVQAGVGTCTVPLVPGKVSARLSRGFAVVAAVVSPNLVDAMPYVQDRGYVAVSSGRTPDPAYAR